MLKAPVLFLSALLLPVAAGWGAKAHVREPASRGAAPRRLDADLVNNSGNTPDTGLGSEGEAALRAQILLDRAHFSPGQIDAKFQDNSVKAVNAFQSSRGLPQTRTVDAATWQALNSDKAAALVPYTITEKDEEGPFIRIPHGMMAQARLKYMGYASPLEELGERFHSSPGLLARLNPGKSFAKAGTEITVPNVLVPPPGEAARVVVNGSEGSLTAFDSNGKVLAWYPATTGSVHDPLPVGEWKILGKAFNPKYHYNSKLFWDASGKDSKATIAPGPNNPVGLVWIDLSKEHYGIHGTPEPSEIGKTASHGCIRLTNWDALELAQMVKPGTPAILKEDNGPAK